jgi:UDP-2-acetamido-3-amino-2,3-dideoxy-glucuronate N-acetyltransferase
MVFINDLTPRSKYPKGSVAYKRPLVKYGASIGANATIVCCNIGSWAMIASGTVITKNVPDNALMAGVPAKQIGWVCECGMSLKGDCQCEECGRSNEVIDSSLIEKQ